MNGVSFFAPQIFAGINALGAGNEGSLIAAVIVNGVQLIATIITVFIVDKIGRRTLLISGSMLGFASEIAVAVVFAVSAGANAVNLPYGASLAAIVLVGVLPTAWPRSRLLSCTSRRDAVDMISPQCAALAGVLSLLLPSCCG